MLVAVAWSSIAFCSEIHDAAENGDLEKVKTLLRANPELVFSNNEAGATPLHMAAMGGHKDIVEFLLANKADINAKNNYGMTPLSISATFGNKDVTELLVANQADINAQDNNGNTALSLATSGGFTNLAELLRQYGGLDTVTMIQDSTMVHEASRSGDLEKVEMLVKRNPDLVSSTDTNGMTPLHSAILGGHEDITRFLLANKTPVNA
ncbi:MAG TPA: ankyrin repeat domain-containing protein, partial [Verrucomicrobiae bacterium]